ncbi:hypothetical protein BDF22DRAFT_684542 [Syncephalis plumigaleata]|nr:hypothetical protein BDF22DRAFT_684542 [Syncephalis plumigaleata]
MVSFRSLSFTAIVVLAILGCANAAPMNPLPGSQSPTGGQGSPQLQAGQRGGLKRVSSQELTRDQELEKNQRPTPQVTSEEMKQILAPFQQEAKNRVQEAELQKELLTRQKTASQRQDVSELQRLLVQMERGSSQVMQKITQDQELIEQIEQTPDRLRPLQWKLLLSQLEKEIPSLRVRYAVWQQLIVELKKTLEQLQ